MIGLSVLILTLPLGLVEADQPGVTLRIWEVGESMVRRAQIEPGQLPSAVGSVPELDLAGPDDFLGYRDHFVLMADGDLVIENPGVFEFQLTSDDGSELWIAGNRVIDHGGLHGAEARTGRLALEAGAHPFQVKFFENDGDEVLRLEWRPPLQSEFSVIPREVLRQRLDPNQPVQPGRKRVVRSPQIRLPGHGSAVRGVHPQWNHQRTPLPGIVGRVTGMEWMDDSHLAILTDAGTLWRFDASPGGASPQRLHRLAEGLEDPGGLMVEDDGIWVIQRGELTRLRDTHGDGRVDQYEAVATGWPIAGPDEGRTRGLAAVGEAFLVALSESHDDAGRPRGSEHRGTILRIERDGSWYLLDDGLREPEGFLQLADGGRMVIDLAAGGGLIPLDGDGRRLPASGISWPPDLATIEAGEVPAAIEVPTGPQEGSIFVADGQQGRLSRIQCDPHAGGVQGTVFRSSHGLGDRIDHVTADAEGIVWAVGSDRSGMTLHRLAAGPSAGFEMESITAYANGLRVDFSQSFDWRHAVDPSAWRLTMRPLSGDSGEIEVLPVEAVYPLEGGRTAFLEISGLQPDRLVHLKLVGPWISDFGEVLHAGEAWYSMVQIPQRRFRDLPSIRLARHNQLTDREVAEGWRSLFDGESWANWRGFGKDEVPEGWGIIDGTIVRSGPAGDLMTVEEFDDFELSLEWKIAPGGNSGIFFNVDGTRSTPWETGPEMQILDNVSHADGKNALTSAGANYALHPPAFDTSAPAGSWNRARIIVRGNEVEHWLNGVRVVDYVLGSPEWQRRVADSKFRSMEGYGRRPAGHIVLQDHGDPVAFRNIRIRVPRNGSPGSGSD